VQLAAADGRQLAAADGRQLAAAGIVREAGGGGWNSARTRPHRHFSINFSQNFFARPLAVLTSPVTPVWQAPQARGI